MIIFTLLLCIQDRSEKKYPKIFDAAKLLFFLYLCN